MLRLEPAPMGASLVGRSHCDTPVLIWTSVAGLVRARGVGFCLVGWEAGRVARLLTVVLSGAIEILAVVAGQLGRLRRGDGEGNVNVRIVPLRCPSSGQLGQRRVGGAGVGGDGGDGRCGRSHGGGEASCPRGVASKQLSTTREVLNQTSGRSDGKGR